MAKTRIKIAKLSLHLPFNLGGIDLEPDETQQRAAWKLYVELTTRIAVQSLATDEGLASEALTSLYSLFGTTRDVLKEAGPEVGAAIDTVGGIAIAVLNRGLRPVLANWHPRLQTWEAQRPSTVGAKEHELKWPEEQQLRAELERLRTELSLYASALAKIAGVQE
jgi:hypothetical protein